MDAGHIPVLLHECIDNLNIRPDGIYVDGTLGMGGHSEQIAGRLTIGTLIGIDQNESPITSFWWGLGGGVVDVRLGSWSCGTPNNLIRYLRGSIARNLYNPFHGPVVDSEGITRVPAHSDPAPADIIKMRYLVEGIEVID